MKVSSLRQRDEEWRRKRRNLGNVNKAPPESKRHLLLPHLDILHPAAQLFSMKSKNIFGCHFVPNPIFPLPTFYERHYTLAERHMSDISKDPEIAIGQQELREAPNDADLIRSLQSGCEKSFDALFAKYWKLVFAIAWKVLRQRSEAEDIVQDVFLTIYLQSDRYDPSRGSVRTWIAQFAYFKALVRRRFLQTVDLTSLDELKEFESGLLRFGNTESVLERAAFVEECLSALKPRQRRTVELVHFDGYTLLETANILKQSLANTRNLYYRGINSLRAQLSSTHTGSSPARTLSGVAAESFILGRT